MRKKFLTLMFVFATLGVTFVSANAETSDRRNNLNTVTERNSLSYQYGYRRYRSYRRYPRYRYYRYNRPRVRYVRIPRIRYYRPYNRRYYRSYNRRYYRPVRYRRYYQYRRY